MRYLAHAVIHDGIVYRQSIVHLDDKEITVTRFAREIHSTVFVPGIIVVAPEERVTTVNIDRMKRIVNRATLIEGAIKRVDRYVTAHNLVVKPGESPRLIILQR